MISRIKKLLSKNKEYLTWNEYTEKIDLFENLSFCQKARRTLLPKK